MNEDTPLPPDLERRLNAVHDEAAKMALEALSLLSDERRKKVLEKFCRSCAVPLESFDWAGRNYCDCCSPDPRED